MSLRHAKTIGGETLNLPKGPPYSCEELQEWAGVSFWMPPGDARLEQISQGERPSPGPLCNLAGMVKYWSEHPDWMDCLNPESPVHLDKQVERAIYLDFWAKRIKPKSRVLDIGGGVGRMAQWLLKQDCEVELVDPDLRSLWRAVSMAAGGPGKLDVHWSTGEKMPSLAPFDIAVACETLNYVENPKKIVENIYKSLKPGGIFLCSVEARWGWAMSSDVAVGGVEAFLGNGIVHVEGDRWIKTYEKQTFQELLEPFENISIQASHFAFSGPFELCTGYLEAEKAIELEARLRAHPVAGRLNRAWMAIAQKPI